MKIKTLPIAQITPYARNPRNIKKNNAVATVKASLKEYGWQQPIVVDQEGVIIAGHTRYLAALERGFDGTFLTALCDPEIGLEFGCRHLGWLAQRYQATFGWVGVAAAYNAGSPRKKARGGWINQDYVDKVCAAGGFL